MPTSTEIRKQLALDGADPFQIAADALLRVAALEAQLQKFVRRSAPTDSITAR